MKRISIVVPPIPEQKAIADFLDKKCGEIDEMVSLQEKIIEELKAYKQSVITEAVCKGLNPDVPMKDSGIEWIGQIPNNWETRIGKKLYLANDGGVWGEEPTGNGDTIDRIQKQLRAAAVRAANCDEHNGERMLDAAQKQAEAVRRISLKQGLFTLPPALREVARIRLENPDLSLKELGEMLDPPVGKSGINHRMRRLMEIAENL